MKTIYAEVFNEDNGLTRAVDFIKVEIPSELKRRIVALSQVVKNLNLYKVEEFFDLPEYFEVDYEISEDLPLPERLTPFGGRLDLVTLNITNDTFWWSGHYRNTDIRWQSMEIPMSSLADSTDLILHT